MTNEKRLAEIKEYLSKMTPGPWEACIDREAHEYNVQIPATHPRSIERAEYWTEAEGQKAEPQTNCITFTTCYDLPEDESNIQGIARLRTDAEWMLSLLTERDFAEELKNASLVPDGVPESRKCQPSSGTVSPAQQNKSAPRVATATAEKSVEYSPSSIPSVQPETQGLVEALQRIYDRAQGAIDFTASDTTKYRALLSVWECAGAALSTYQQAHKSVQGV